jgi:hypothetical protein
MGQPQYEWIGSECSFGNRDSDWDYDTLVTLAPGLAPSEVSDLWNVRHDKHQLMYMGMSAGKVQMEVLVSILHDELSQDERFSGVVLLNTKTYEVYLIGVGSMTTRYAVHASSPA